ncbi:MAG: TIGR02391 family protein [Negativicutes bacterium]
MNVPCFNAQTIEIIVKILSEKITGSQITQMFANFQLHDDLGPKGTKWKRLFNAVVQKQNSTNNGHALCQIIEWVMNPVAHLLSEKLRETYAQTRQELNSVLAFSGIQLTDEGKLTLGSKIHSHTEAIQRLDSLKKSLEPFHIHPRLLAVCRPELLTEDFFHLVFEAAKLAANQIKEISGLKTDGNTLVNEAFQGKNPRLILNTLQTDDEKSEHNALKSLLHFIIYFYRNPKAHKLKVYSPAKEEDAVIALSNISTALYLLDKCQRNSTLGS